MTNPDAAVDNSEILSRLLANGPPTHVAVIMDGNGRWARERGLPRRRGHRAGMSAVREVIKGAAEAEVRHLTLYAFSNENWDRPADEVGALMALLEEYAQSDRDELARAGIRVTVFGDRERLSATARRAIAELEASTSGGGALDVHLAISYGARGEITEACRSLARDCAAGVLSPDDIEPGHLDARLMTGDWPDPDLLIRTSGEYRISNFLLWQLAYAEIYVTEVLWPDFTRRELFHAILDYQGRDRRFGLVST
ncbi:MAG: polyprenyl diphosphate synthase [Gemmatimonadota bacterium]|nr:polyprenyl diphosphate synthase [Gemmatimonadota bacterium]